MKIKTGNEQSWEKFKQVNKPSQDDPGYGQAVIDYAVAWADAMEARMASETPTPLVADIAKSCEPTGHGITGFQYGAAVATLRDHWEHGADLNAWHNARYGHPTAQGTVNPAILTIGRTDA